jgi:hypothetical protein
LLLETANVLLMTTLLFLLYYMYIIIIIIIIITIIIIIIIIPWKHLLSKTDFFYVHLQDITSKFLIPSPCLYFFAYKQCFIRNAWICLRCMVMSTFTCLASMAYYLSPSSQKAEYRFQADLTVLFDILQNIALKQLHIFQRSIVVRIFMFLYQMAIMSLPSHKFVCPPFCCYWSQ